jgi:hypothetical protein
MAQTNELIKTFKKVFWLDHEASFSRPTATPILSSVP